MQGRRSVTASAAISSVLGLVGAACFDPHFHDPTCGPSGACPSGWSCAAGVGAPCTQMIPPDASDADADAAPDAAACAPQWHDVLQNGNFEQGHAIWVEGPTGETAICDKSQLTLSTKDGNYAACFGLRNDRYQILTQQVTLPAGTTRVRLQGYRCLVTSETDGTVHDTITLRVVRVEDDTTAIANLATWSNKDGASTCRWDAFDLIADVSAPPAAGVLRIESKLDSDHVTSLYLDVLSLQAFAPCAGA
jgi:hypothetical protein